MGGRTHLHLNSGKRMIMLAFAGTMLAAFPAAASAGDFTTDLPPLSRPLPCPIDAPVRVASEDTLKRFTALADCDPAAIIVSPATELPRPRGPVVIGPAGAEVDEVPGGVFVADQEDSAKRRSKSKRRQRAEPPAATVQIATVGRSETKVVRIAPKVQFPELELVAVIAEPAVTLGAGQAPVAAGPLTESAILALSPASYTTPHDSLISSAAARHGVDPLMLHAVITQESRYRPSAVSPVGARGLMQVMPGTGAMLGVRNPAHLMDPATNIDAGARLLKRLWRRFAGRFDLVLAAYNAGEGAVTKYGYKVPPYRETQNYVVLVQGIYRKLVAERGLSFAAR